jgi:NAD(P)-dependent dehydrogenase (short-subunit alcohol dehydrogenase family)
MTSRRVSLVTGASQGIGRVIAEAFGGLGDAVVLAARNAAGLIETAGMVEAAGGEPLVVEADVTSLDETEHMARVAVERYGRLDCVVANAGVGGPSRVLWQVDPDDWDATFAVNVKGAFLTARAVLPAMIDAGKGSLVFVGSISGKRPLFGRSAYTASKSALIGLTRTLATEVGPAGIRVNLVSPGFVEGPRMQWVIRAQAEVRGVPETAVQAELDAISPLGRLTAAGEVADAVLFLCSDAAAGITGTELDVNAGAAMY